MTQNLPAHVAIIMDGNGRWAKARGLPRAMGHRAGVNALFPLIEHCSDLGIPCLTLFAFSTENWSRPSDEVGALMGLLLEFWAGSVERLARAGVRVRMLGDIDGLPPPQRNAALRAVERTRDGRKMTLSIAINYGGRADIVQAARQLAALAKDGRLRPEDIDQSAFAERLYTAGLPDVDLLIRTSGEMRLSNFLLYQSAYAELYVAPELWPDFTPAAFDRALGAFAARSRRFGGAAPEGTP